jgi:type VI protein secretion system component VasF
MYKRIRPILGKGLELARMSDADLKKTVKTSRQVLFADLARTRALESDPWPITYALSTWLDELLTAKDNDWIEGKLETEIFNTNDRGWAFWEKASQALTDAGTGDSASIEKLEVFTFCVIFGFIGDRHDQDRDDWFQDSRAQLTASSEPAPNSPKPKAPTSPPSLVGNRQLKQTAYWIFFPIVALLMFESILGFVLVRYAF